VVPSVQVANPALDAFGKFKIDPMPIATYGKNTAAAQRLADDRRLAVALRAQIAGAIASRSAAQFAPE
jgi:hypothetical protein